MIDHGVISRRALLATALGLALPAAAQAQCPPAEQVAKTIEKVFNRPGIEVKRIKPTPVRGLCEVQIVLQRRGNLLYTDETGAHFIINGTLVDTATKKNLTEGTLVALNEELDALNVLKPDELKKIDALVALTVGTKGKPVYFVTDPM